MPVFNSFAIFHRLFSYGGVFFVEYTTIRERAENSFIEKKSEFIGYICPVKTADEAINFINEIRNMHRKSNS